jgi:hypothetical protein
MTRPTGGRRIFLGAYKPPKAVNQMTDPERYAWAEAVADAMSARAQHASGDDGSPRLRARTQAGVLHDHPSADLLRELLFGLGPGAGFLVVDRLDPPDKDHFAQVRQAADGTWVIEYRDGGPERHYQATTTDSSVVREVLIGWARGLTGWRERLTWIELRLPTS